MVCDDCKKNQASIHFSQIVNNKKTELKLCHSCAEKRGFTNAVQGGKFGMGNLVLKIAAESATDEAEASCPRCRLKYASFQKAGRLGCDHCYQAFEPQLRDLIKKIHGAETHSGKVPKNMEPVVATNRKIELQRKALRDAVQLEDFEKAAAIRDRIRKMENSEI